MRRDARLLQSPRSGTVAGGHALAAGIAQNGRREAGCWFCPNAALRAVPARLLLLCLLFRSSWLTVEAAVVRCAATVLHRRGGRAAVAVRSAWLVAFQASSVRRSDSVSRDCCK